MASFSRQSLTALSQADPRLETLFKEVIQHFDCVVLCSYRDELAQNEAFASGKSKTPWPESKHNHNPSLAVDVAPYPVDWENASRFYLFAGFVLAIASTLKIPVRWGGDWNSNLDPSDENFQDLVHFEIV